MLTTKRVIAAGAVLLIAAAAQAQTTTDEAAAVLIYPKIVFNNETPTDTLIEIANVDPSNVARLHCFYVNATGHCTNTGLACNAAIDCGGLGACVPGWAEIDFSVVLTRNQPFYWLASQGRNRTCRDEGDCEPLPLASLGFCENFPLVPCADDFDCGIGDNCITTQTNAGTSIPPVPEDEYFIGELKCAVVNEDGNPLLSNVLIGTATLVSTVNGTPDAQSYNAVGVRARDGQCDDGDEPIPGAYCDTNDGDADCGTAETCEPLAPNAFVDGSVIELGAGNEGYQACAEFLIVDHIFDGAPDPIGTGFFVTDLTLVPCTENFRLGNALLGRSTAQFLVYNEFEQRFSSSLPVTCFDERLMSNIDTSSNERSIFSVAVSGTVAGQTRIHPIGAGLVGVARAMKPIFPGALQEGNQDLFMISQLRQDPGLAPVIGVGAAYELHQQGVRTETDRIVLP